MAVTRTALVTGATRGLGVEVARQLSMLGYRVVLAARDLAKAHAMVAEIDATSVPLRLDISDPGSIDEAVAELSREGLEIDILVNNAGVHYDTWERATTVDWQIVEETLAIHVRGPWRLAAALAPGMRARGWGRVVNVSSEAGSLSMMAGETPAYSVSKAALNALTRCLAGELKDSGVLVNAVTPGWTATDMGGGGRPVAEGATSIVWAATLPDDGPTGGFYRDGESLPW